MNMNWLNIKYIGRAGLIIILLFFTCPSSATCKTDTVINTYKRDSLGNRYIARIHPEIFVEKDKSDNDTETELYALEY